MDLSLYFPIAGLSFNVLTILAVGMVGGIVSSGLGIGSGVIVTPALLTLIGVPPFVAVTSQMGNAIGVNLIGFLGYWRKRDVDFSLGFCLLIGGILGAFTEMYLFQWLKKGDVNEKIALLNVIVLTSLATLFLAQNIKALFKPAHSDKSITMRYWMIYFPWHKIFIRSRTEISILIPILVGFGTGLLTSTLGGGNSLFMMPLLSYLIGRVTPVVQGTTLFAGFIITMVVTVIHCCTHSPFDLLLVFFLLIGGTFGSRIGVLLSYFFPRQYLGLLGAGVIYLISAKFAFNLWHHFSGSVTIKSIATFKDASSPPSNQLWTLNLANFLDQSLMSYTVLGIISIILVAIILEKALQRAIILFYK
jgi:uncharacterized membrane protein YfcA